MNHPVPLSMWLALVDHHKALQLILSTGVLYMCPHNETFISDFMFIVKYSGQNLLASNHLIWTAVKQQQYTQI